MVIIQKNNEWMEMVIDDEWNGYSLDHLLRHIWKAPKKQIHLMRMDKEVYVNGENPRWNMPLNKGDVLQLKIFKEEPFHAEPAFLDIEILYEDEHAAIFNKPAGIDTHPNDAQQKNTLTNAAIYHMHKQQVQRDIRHVHRLDRDTSGAVLFSKNAFAGSIFDKMLEERLIKRTYLALVHGQMKKKTGIIDQPIGRDRHHPTRRRVSDKGQMARTHYEAVHVFPNENLTLVKCQLDTGRTHQIRVHLSHIGHPLAGDILYGGKPIFPHQALHASELTFTHPFTLEKIEVKCAPPSIFDKFMNNY